MKNPHESMLYSVHDARQVLQHLGQNVPSTGMDAYSHGVRLAALMDLLCQWGSWLGRKEGASPQVRFAPHESPALWSRLHQHWPELLAQQAEAFAKVPGQISYDLASYPVQLRAFCARHRGLAVPISGQYDDNDLEIDELLAPAFALQDALESQVLEHLRSQPGWAKALPWWRKHLFWILVGGVALFYAASGLLRSRPAPQTTPMVKGLPPGAVPGGILGSYYQGKNFKRLVQRRIDKDIWFYWGGAPISGVSANYFSVRWSGYIKIPRKGRYKFCLRHDDGGLVYLGKKTLLPHWNSSDKTHCASITLPAGWHVLKVQMFDNYGRAFAKFSWQPPGAKHPSKVPSSHLCCRKKAP